MASKLSGLVLAVFAIVIAAATLSACSVPSKPMPDIDGRVAIKVSNDKFTRRPFGAYQIPDTAVYVSGHQGAADVAMLFGLIGIVAGDEAARSTGDKKTKGAEPHLRLDLAGLTERVLAERLARYADEGRFVVADGSVAATLEVTPYLVVNFVGDDQARLWVVLRTALKNTNQPWKAQYIAGVGRARSIDGDQGWGAQEGMFLREAVGKNLQRAIDVLLKDVSRAAFPRDRSRLVTVKANWLWLKMPRARAAILLDETDEALVVFPCAYERDSDGFAFTGVTVLDKTAATVARETDQTKPCLGSHLDL